MAALVKKLGSSFSRWFTRRGDLTRRWYETENCGVH